LVVQNKRIVLALILEKLAHTSSQIEIFHIKVKELRIHFVVIDPLETTAQFIDSPSQGAYVVRPAIPLPFFPPSHG